MLDHVFHTNIIAYCQQNRYVRLAIYTDLFTLKYCCVCRPTYKKVKTMDARKSAKGLAYA